MQLEMDTEEENQVDAVVQQIGGSERE